AWPAFEAGPQRRLVVGAALVGVVAGAVLMAPEFLRPIPTATAAPSAAHPPLKLLTFNVWDDNPFRDKTIAAIVGSGADVVTMQELENFNAAQRARLTSVYPYWAHCPAGCDLAMLSKRPWTATRWSSSPEAPAFGALWGSTTAPDGRPVALMTTHYAWPFPIHLQASQRAALAHLMRQTDKSNLILAGDFNLAPWTAALKRQDAAFAPLVRRTRALFSWPATIARLDKPAPFPILPIDQVYASPDWLTVRTTRLPWAGSDHYGVLATLERAR
ncbi:MAG: endonuclease/exonuclease/phosphatase family protein, partial [Caulobacteraceae bacterium]